ncbi:MAG: helix-turn-helix domain-containing protein, partial [Acidobacteria bacterium]|nr:helix-turn-helix domain-containing protein [Acidobacteriota bacterium]
AECEQIPALRIGRHWRFHPAELDQWLAMRGTGGSAGSLRSGAGAAAREHTSS